MVMEREQHELLLNELLSADLPVSRLTEIAQEMRVDHVETTEQYGGLTQQVEFLTRDNEDLVKSNSKWFRMLGEDTKVPDVKEVEKTFSETITLESLENGG